MQPKPTEKNSAEYTNLVNLMAVYSETSNRLAEIVAEANGELMLWLDENKSEYAALQETLAKTEAALELTALAHPDWFVRRKSIVTPYGTVKLTASSKLEIPNAEVTAALLSAEASAKNGFKLETYLRHVPTLDLEALEKLDDATLARYRINRVTTQNFSVKPAEVDLGKAARQPVTEKSAA